MQVQPTPNNVLPFRPLANEPSPAAPAVQPSTSLHLQFYPSGSEIYGQGETAGPVYLVEFGAVRVYRLLPGLGARITQSISSSRDAAGWAYVLAACLLGLLFFVAALAVERLAAPWRARQVS